ncbi:MAG: hypothetical protein PHC51_04080 [bacterium]|nr:hypothetical protein [bacterium]
MIDSVEASPEQEAAAGLKFRYYLNNKSSGPVIFMVHGRAGNHGAMWTFSRALRGLQPKAIIAPQAPLSDPIGGYSWWPVELSASGTADVQSSEKLLLAGLDYLDSFIFRTCRLFSLEPCSLFGVGFSQGAGAISGLSIKNRLLFSRVALLAGFVPGVSLRMEEEVAKNVRQTGDGETTPASHRAPTLPSLPKYFFAHGSKDKIIPLEKAERCAKRLQSLGAETTFHIEDTAHKVGTGGLKALSHWLAS